jgi:hypothetical protein
MKQIFVATLLLVTSISQARVLMNTGDNDYNYKTHILTGDNTVTIDGTEGRALYNRLKARPIINGNYNVKFLKLGDNSNFRVLECYEVVTLDDTRRQITPDEATCYIGSGRLLSNDQYK